MSEPLTELKPFLAKVVAGDILGFDDACTAFDIIMSGQATPAR